MNKKILFVTLILLLMITTGCNCKEKEGSCCNGLVCSETNINCEMGTSAKFLGCDDNCMAQWTCESLAP